MSLSNQDFRSIMSLFPTGVAVITAKPEGHAAIGLTVNSFTSVSLSPPLISWNIQKSSDTYELWAEMEWFGVNFLRSDQQDKSSQFARKGAHDVDEADYQMGESGCPTLIDALARMECRTHAIHEAGDHAIILGEVMDMSAGTSCDPLVFHKGRYAALRQ